MDIKSRAQENTDSMGGGGEAERRRELFWGGSDLLKHDARSIPEESKDRSGLRVFTLDEDLRHGVSGHCQRITFSPDDEQPKDEDSDANRRRGQAYIGERQVGMRVCVAKRVSRWWCEDEG